MTIHSKPTSKGFTLMEILVVVAIIATLAGISYPIAQNMLNRSKETQTIARMKEFESAILNYNDTKGQLPHAGTAYPAADTTLSAADTTAILTDLINNDMLSMPEAKNGRNGIIYAANAPTSIVDAWGTPFYIQIDYDLNSSITQNHSTDGAGIIQNKTVIIISNGADQASNGNDDLYSWE